MNEKIKTSYALRGETIDWIDKRSDESFRKKSEQLESDLSLLWSLLEYGFLDAKKVLSKNEVLLITKVMSGRRIMGEDMFVWAKSGLVSELQKTIAFLSSTEKQNIDSEALVSKIENMSIIERIALCDWGIRFWSMHNKKEVVEEW